MMLLSGTPQVVDRIQDMKAADMVLPRILIVDDESPIRNLLQSILADKYACTTADSAETALSYLENESFDLVVSDINMGGMSGIELASRVTESSPDTVVMMISGNHLIDSPIDAIRSGAFDYIRKPFEIDQVLMAVDRAIGHGSLLTSKRRHETELEQLVAERTESLNYLAYNDPVTGLSNRAFFEEYLKSLLDNQMGERVVIAFITLDRFRGIRDTLGHVLGDRILKEVGNRLTKLGKARSVAARFEGDEFALILGDQDDDLAVFVGELFDEFKAPFTVGEYEIYITASVGISLSPDDGSDPQTLLRNAGSALSHAQSQGGNNCQFFTADIHEKALRKLTLENDLRRALERDEFELFYQPKLDVNSRQIVGMEALVRWNHPNLGLLCPVEFIPVAEETGLIVPMGEWILRSACVQAKLWHEIGYGLKVAVNLSACQFQQSDLAERILQIVKETGLGYEYLNLEVTESSIMNNPESAVAVLRRLKEKGIRISIDDFGTGHSSLGYLKNLPIDVLKIDKSFVSDVTTNRDDAALVMAIIHLAHTLRLRVVAEGVETEEQLAFLHLLRCDQWQGYLFSKPLSASAFEKLLTEDMVFRVGQ